MRLHFLYFTLFLFSFFLKAEEPWGKEADLSYCQSIETNKKTSSLLSKCGIAAIRFHQVIISPADGPRSHFLPSSSQYTLEAMREYGFFTGYMLGCDRLMRENDDEWVYPTKKNEAGQVLKSNPVPRIIP